MSRFHLLRKSGKQLHAPLALLRGHVLANASDHRKMKIGLQRPLQYHAVNVHQRQVASLPKKSNRSSLGDFHFDFVGQCAPDQSFRHPRNRLNLTTPFVQRNAQDAVPLISLKNPKYVCPRHVVISRQLHLVLMNERHLPRRQQEMSAGIGQAPPEDPQAHSKGDAQIRFPSLPAEFPPLDLQRLLPSKILWLFVGQQLLGISVRVDGLQFFQRMTSFSSSTPKVLCTRSRTSSISRSMSAQLAVPALMKKFACRSLTIASPARCPFNPSSSIIRPAEPPAGFLKMHPALFWFSGWLARRFSLHTRIPARISLNGLDGSSSFTRSITSSTAKEVWR